jgi:aspartate/methionine/tyrosine aminotransferase
MLETAPARAVGLESAVGWLGQRALMWLAGKAARLMAGWAVEPPRATMFAWAPVPEPFRAMGSLEFSKLLLREAKVAVSPGIGFGEHGEGFVRFALIENRHRINQAVRSIRRVLERGYVPAGE